MILKNHTPAPHLILSAMSCVEKLRGQDLIEGCHFPFENQSSCSRDCVATHPHPPAVSATSVTTVCISF
jgi:hypothetical protein